MMKGLDIPWLSGLSATSRRVFVELDGKWHDVRPMTEYLVWCELPRDKRWGLSQNDTRNAEGTGPGGWWLVLYSGTMTPVTDRRS